MIYILQLQYTTNKSLFLLSQPLLNGLEDASSSDLQESCKSFMFSSGTKWLLVLATGKYVKQYWYMQVFRIFLEPQFLKTKF